MNKEGSNENSREKIKKKGRKIGFHESEKLVKEEEKSYFLFRHWNIPLTLTIKLRLHCQQISK